MKNDESYDRAMNDLMEAKEEIIKLNSELTKWKSTAAGAYTALEMMRKEKDYWQFIVQQGGTNG